MLWDFFAGGVRVPIAELLDDPGVPLHFTLYDKAKQATGTIQASRYIMNASPLLTPLPCPALYLARPWISLCDMLCLR